MKRLLSSALAAFALFALAAPALAKHDDEHHEHHDRGNHYGWDRDGDYHSWQHGPHRYRHWHGRDVTYWNGGWGYWEPRDGTHIFISIRL
jgi:hypothetical protein